MRFPFRQWTDAEKWVMGLLSAAIFATTGLVWKAFEREVVATIANGLDNFGRCVDKEIRIANETSKDSIDLLISFEVDHFTRHGFIAIEYGDEREQMIPPARKTLIPRSDFVPIKVILDAEASTVSVPKLQPGQRVHLFFGAETVYDTELSAKREKLLWARDADLMNKPRVTAITRKDGEVSLERVFGCRPQ